MAGPAVAGRQVRRLRAGFVGGAFRDALKELLPAGVWHTLRRMCGGSRVPWVVWVLLALAVILLDARGVGAQAQPAQQAAAAEEAEDDAKEGETRLPWHDTTFIFAQSLSINSFSKSAQTSYNPTYSWVLILAPRWYLTKNIYANIDQRLNLELTDSDTALHRQRALLTDMVAGVDAKFVSLRLPRFGKFGSSAGLHAILPLSLASQAATMTMGGRVRAIADLKLDHVLHGATLAVEGRYAHRFLRHNTLQVDEPFNCVLSGASVQNCAFLDSGPNIENSLSSIVSASLELNQYFSVSLLAWLSWSRSANLGTASTTIDSQLRVDRPDMSTTHWHNDRYLVLGVGYNLTDWMNLGVSMINYYSERSSDGTLRSLAKPVDLAFGMTVEIAVDELYLAASGRGGDDEEDED